VTETSVPRIGVEAPPPPLLVATELALAVLCGIGFIAVGAGEGAWILGGIAAGAIVYRLHLARSPLSLKPNRNARKIGQMFVGLTVGVAVQTHDLTHLLPQLPIFVLFTLLLLVSGVAIGLLYSRLQKTDFLTAMLATVPGNIGIMASIAADYEKDAAIVSLVQLLRFTAVTLIVPLLANVAHSHDVGAIAQGLAQDVASFSLADFWQLAAVLALTAIAADLGSKAKIPVAAFFCPILVGIGLNVLLLSVSPGASLHLPLLLKVIGQILLGLTIGEYWALNPPLNRRAIVTATIPVFLTLAVGLLSAGIAMRLMPWDWLTCLLVTAPGGSPEMIWISLALNHDVETVTTGHLMRLMIINLMLPLLVSLGRYIDGQVDGRSNHSKIIENA